MTKVITKSALTLKALFAVAAVATAVVAMPSGPDFAVGGSPAYAKKISSVSKSKLKAACKKAGGVFIDWGKGEYSCDWKGSGKGAWIHCAKKVCHGKINRSRATGPKRPARHNLNRSRARPLARDNRNRRPYVRKNRVR